jgi:hypothetical protein
MDEQTIWLSPRATHFAEVCDSCADEHPEIFVAVTVVGELAAGAADGWAQCPRGHRMRVNRIGVGMPAGALR